MAEVRHPSSSLVYHGEILPSREPSHAFATPHPIVHCISRRGAHTLRHAIKLHDLGIDGSVVVECVVEVGDFLILAPPLSILEMKIVRYHRLWHQITFARRVSIASIYSAFAIHKWKKRIPLFLFFFFFFFNVGISIHILIRAENILLEFLFYFLF